MNENNRKTEGDKQPSQLIQDLNSMLSRRTVLISLGASGLVACGGGSDGPANIPPSSTTPPVTPTTPPPEKLLAFPGDNTIFTLGTPSKAEWNDVAVATIGDQFALGKGTDGDWAAHAVITTQWHYVRMVDGTQELYDIQNDPFGYSNLLATDQGMSSHRGTVAALSAYLPRWNDELYGGAGEDIYIVGGGRTLINESAGLAGEVDIIRLPYAQLSELSLSRTAHSQDEANDSLLITHPGGEIIVYGHFRDSFRQIETIECSDGVIDSEQINQT